MQKQSGDIYSLPLFGAKAELCSRSMTKKVLLECLFGCIRHLQLVGFAATMFERSGLRVCYTSARAEN